jgi:hypothetical protein
MRRLEGMMNIPESGFVHGRLHILEMQSKNIYLKRKLQGLGGGLCLRLAGILGYASVPPQNIIKLYRSFKCILL